MGHQKRGFQAIVTALPCVQQTMSVDLFNLQFLVDQWEGQDQIAMKLEEHFPSWIPTNFTHVIERFCLYLDSAGKTVNAGVPERVALDDVNELVEVFVFGRDVRFWLGALILEIGLTDEKK